MKTLLLTNEFPPHVYGGAGVHVDYLTRSLRRSIEVEVRCFGDQDTREPNLRVHGFPTPETVLTGCDPRVRGAFDALGRSIAFAATPTDADVVHCHTWYSHFGGLLAKLAFAKPLVITVHSLEPLRPWKREQLGGGFEVSSWIERTALTAADAVIAVSAGARDDILAHFAVDPARIHVIHNGIDTDEYRPTTSTATPASFGIDPNKPYVLFVGRITRQKGILHLVRAIAHLDADLQVVLCAGAPDTAEIAAEMTAAVRAAQAKRPGIFWIEAMLPRPQLIELYSNAAVFCCPSIYEPFGLINLEAMACGTAVVASAVGGIPEVVVPGETGELVTFPASTDGAPLDPDRFERDLATAIERIVAVPQRQQAMGAAGRRRAIERFSWATIAERTIDVYRGVQ